MLDSQGESQSIFLPYNIPGCLLRWRAPAAGKRDILFDRIPGCDVKRPGGAEEKGQGLRQMQKQRMARALLAIVGIALAADLLDWCVQAQPGSRKEIQDNPFPGDPPDDFFEGNYLIVGQKPSGGASYKGRAHIEIKGQKIRLTRTVNGTKTVVEGKFVPGGESKKKCLQFNWRDSHGQAEMFCQYAVDFDNYARLSCLWSYGATADGLPGLESFYPSDGLSKKRTAAVFSKKSDELPVPSDR